MYEYEELFDLGQDMDYWRSLVNAALNFQVPYTIKLVSYITELY